MASKLRDCDQARMGNQAVTHDFGYGALQQQAREIAAGILRTEYNIYSEQEILTEYKSHRRMRNSMFPCPERAP